MTRLCPRGSPGALAHMSARGLKCCKDNFARLSRCERRISIYYGWLERANFKLCKPSRFLKATNALSFWCLHAPRGGCRLRCSGALPQTSVCDQAQALFAKTALPRRACVIFHCPFLVQALSGRGIERAAWWRHLQSWRLRIVSETTAVRTLSGRKRVSPPRTGYQP